MDWQDPPLIDYLLTFAMQYISTIYFIREGAIAMSSANGLVGTGFACRYRIQPRPGFKGPMGRCKATTPSSFSLTSNGVTSNY